jgi:hypothetical protein
MTVVDRSDQEERMTVDPSTFKQGRAATPEEKAYMDAQWPAEKRRRWIFQNCYFGHGQMLAKNMRYIMKDGVEQVKTTYFCECGYSLVQYVPRTLALQIVNEGCLPPPLETGEQ